MKPKSVFINKTAFVDMQRQGNRPEFKKYAYKRTDYTEKIDFYQNPLNKKNWTCVN